MNGSLAKSIDFIKQQVVKIEIRYVVTQKIVVEVLILRKR